MSGPARFKYLILGILLVMASVNFAKTTRDILKSSKRLEDLENEVSSLEIKKIDLEKEVSYKQTSDFVEESARNDLNMIKPGEKVYVVVGTDSKTGVLGEMTKKITGGRDARNTNLYSWYKLFF